LRRWPPGGQPATPPPATWWAAAPIIADGKVIVTPPETQELICVNLANGKLLWSAPRDDDLYLAAVADGKVVLVGPSHCRALNLADGTPAWRTETGIPAGLGVMLEGGRYLLPLRSAAGTGKPAFALVELKTGSVAETVPMADADDLGNLAVHGGMVLSQSLKRLTAFPMR
jgi:hypothetical protein